MLAIRIATQEYGEWMRIGMAWRERYSQSNSIKLTELYACMNVGPFPSLSTAVANLIFISNDRIRATNHRIFSWDYTSFKIRNQIVIERDPAWTRSRRQNLVNNFLLRQHAAYDIRRNTYTTIDRPWRPPFTIPMMIPFDRIKLLLSSCTYPSLTAHVKNSSEFVFRNIIDNIRDYAKNLQDVN